MGIKQVNGEVSDMLKCNCGKEMQILESFAGKFLKCECGEELWLNEVVERCEKAEAELEVVKGRIEGIESKENDWRGEDTETEYTNKGFNDCLKLVKSLLKGGE